MLQIQGNVYFFSYVYDILEKRASHRRLKGVFHGSKLGHFFHELRHSHHHYPHWALAPHKAPKARKRLVRPLQRPFHVVQGGVEIRPEELRQKKPFNGDHRPGDFDPFERRLRRVGPDGSEFRELSHRSNRFGGALRNGRKGTETAVWIAKEDTGFPYPLLFLGEPRCPGGKPKNRGMSLIITAFAAQFIC